MSAKTKIAGVMVVLMALSSPMVYADQGPGNGWHHGQQDGHMMAKVLGLNDDQIKALKDIHQKQREAMKSVFEQMKSNREALNAEIANASPDMNKVNDLQNQLKALQGQMVDNHLNTLMDIKKVLTPAQFSGFMALQKEHQLKMREQRFARKDGCKDGGHGQWGQGHSFNGQD